MNQEKAETCVVSGAGPNFYLEREVLSRMGQVAQSNDYVQAFDNWSANK